MLSNQWAEKLTVKQHLKCNCYYGNKDSRLSTDADRVFGDLDHGAFQFHDDSADGWFTVRQLTSQLNVEIFIAVVTVWGEDVVAGGWQLNNVSIERLVMVVTPRTTNQLVVLWTQSWKIFYSVIMLPMKNQHVRSMYRFLPEIIWITAVGWMVIAGRSAGNSQKRSAILNCLQKHTWLT